MLERIIRDKKKLAVAVVLGIMLLASAVRTYRFDDWLYFKMDQARDAMVIKNAIVNGPEHLPFLGPRAGATEVASGYLRLGPIFYYFQYLGAFLSGSTEPAAFAYADLFFPSQYCP